MMGADVTRAVFQAIKEFMEQNSIAHFFGLERGNLEENLHLQGVAKIRALSLASLRNWIKEHLSARGCSDGLNLMVRVLRGVSSEPICTADFALLTLCFPGSPSYLAWYDWLLQEGYWKGALRRVQQGRL